VKLRFFVANPTGKPEDDRVFINPVLSAPSREVEEADEGCLSLPDITGLIRRPKSITIHALDLEGSSFELTSDQLAARVWQHETDHLDGVLIIDRMAPLDRLANQRLLREMERSEGGGESAGRSADARAGAGGSPGRGSAKRPG
jgi:peptide deformylase